ncbi:hypothetical protein BS333_07265 [Vibrio azureus]|uniref:Translocator protein BipB-like C-terminal domain-containing protein n=1 Tax=Vibrio azureus NBRC 104587 TaxID=1219077 RepID=U3AD67_9VIBR|nr:type III secretion system translocon subunit SctE [Vibrio azureus]AUI86203.1 hypothetical protein BS333_07265 [Vibrio azureus]GAD77851.1 hypothetical protein VAZ01S_096_00030 [Vibrio azureus NBRC 104587]
MSSITTLDRAQLLASVNKQELETLKDVTSVSKTTKNGDSLINVNDLELKNVVSQNSTGLFVQLDKPNSELVNQATRSFPEVSKEIGQVQGIAAAQIEVVEAFSDQIIGSLQKNLLGQNRSSAQSKSVDFELAFALMMNKLENIQSNLTINKIKTTKDKYEKEMVENKQKIEEAEKAAQNSKQASKASQVIGWMSAFASLAVGGVLAFTGVGLLAVAAGASMLIAGGIELTQKVINIPEVKSSIENVIGEDAFKAIDTTLTVGAIAFAVSSLLITGGGSAANLMTKLGTKLPGSVGNLLTNAGSKATTLIASAENIGARTATTTGHITRFSAEGADLALDISKGISSTVYTARQAQSAEVQADIADLKAKMALTEATLEKLKDEMTKATEVHRELMITMMQTMQSNFTSLKTLNARPQVI